MHHQSHSLGEVILRKGVQPDPQKIIALIDMPVPNNKKELQAFLSIINYLGKFSPGTADVCDPLHKLTPKLSNMDMECVLPGTV